VVAGAVLGVIPSRRIFSATTKIASKILIIIKKNGAGDGDRTHDIHLGKLVQVKQKQSETSISEPEIAAILADFENALEDDVHFWLVVGQRWLRAARYHDDKVDLAVHFLRVPS
jgi:hypothetical protein